MARRLEHLREYAEYLSAIDDEDYPGDELTQDELVSWISAKQSDLDVRLITYNPMPFDNEIEGKKRRIFNQYHWYLQKRGYSRTDFIPQKIKDEYHEQKENPALINEYKEYVKNQKLFINEWNLNTKNKIELFYENIELRKLLRDNHIPYQVKEYGQAKHPNLYTFFVKEHGYTKAPKKNSPEGIEMSTRYDKFKEMPILFDRYRLGTTQERRELIKYFDDFCKLDYMQQHEILTQLNAQASPPTNQDGSEQD